MARHFQLLLLVLTCFSVGAEVLTAASGLPIVQTDQVHDCGTEDTRVPGETEGANETDSADLSMAGNHPPMMTPLAFVAQAQECRLDHRAGMRRHRWCGVDLN